MLVSELKKELEKYSSKEKDKIIVELYKRIPKKVKEDYEIDNMIINLKENIQTKLQKETMSFEQLEAEINYFLTCARNGLYASPNRVISKPERSKWRFKVKKYYKELTNIDPNTENGKKATDLLRQIYLILSIGSNYLTFSNWETFQAVQISQPEFFETVANRKLMIEVSKQSLEYCVDLLDVVKSPYILFEDLIFAFLNCLKTSDMKYVAVLLIEEKIKYYKEKLVEIKKAKKDTYDTTEKINDFTLAGVYIYFSLNEIEAGIKFFHKYHSHFDKEVNEYILLEIIEFFGLDEEWIKEYEKHLGKIDYRDGLKEKYIEKKRKN